MLDGRFSCPLRASARVTETCKDEGVLLPLGVKQRRLCLRDHEYCLHHVLCLIQLSIACNLIPMGDRLDSRLDSDPTVDFLDKDVVGLNGLCSLS